jgi:5-methylthioadenosine/S-adenosylhomocysteine deaminase
MSPTKYLDSLGALGPETLAAHCLWIDDDDIEILAKEG